MIKQELYTDNSNSDDDDNGLYNVMKRFIDVLPKYNNEGWVCINHTIIKDDEGDWLLTAVFNQVEEGG